jgi:hypothetical protein
MNQFTSTAWPQYPQAQAVELPVSAWAGLRKPGKARLGVPVCWRRFVGREDLGGTAGAERSPQRAIQASALSGLEFSGTPSELGKSP